MKILFLTHAFYPNIGGLETIAEILADNFVKEGHDVHLITWTEDRSKMYFPYKVIRKPSKLKLIQEHRWADVVFENNVCLRLSWPSIITRKPLVASLQSWLNKNFGESRFQDKVKRIWLKRARGVIACSDSVRREVFPNAVVVHNAYNQDLFKRIESIEKNKDFVFLGRLVRGKGADLAISAFKLLLDRTGKTSSLAIIGDGPEKKNLEILVDKLGLENKVEFKGVLRGKQLVEELNHYKYMLVPSRFPEPFGIVALEGLACGCIPIVSHDGGLVDAIGKEGLIFTNGDVESLYIQMSKVYDFKQTDVKSHLKNFSPESIAKQYLKVLISSKL